MNSRTVKKIRFGIILTAAVALVLTASFAGHTVPYDPIETNLTESLSPPDRNHIAGTDKLGRDIYSRILSGAGISFFLTFIMVVIITLTGTVIGMLCGFFGGKFDAAVMRLVDILLAFPETVFAIAVAGMLGPGLLNTVIAMSLVGWTRFACMARSLTATIREKGYVIQAGFNGASTAKVIFKYILPNMAPHIVVMAAMSVGGMMMSLAGLSFLGLASQPPAAEWGYMLYESRQYMQIAPWMMIYPGIALLITVIIFNLLGDSLRDIMDRKN